MSEKTIITKKTRKKSASEQHKTGECCCSILVNPNNCIYQQFLDGWNFTPDVGNGQKRGEVFTPRFIVDKMVENIGMFPKEAVYELNYSAINKEKILEIIDAKIVEPAVGTGNYTSTILWHKLEYANQAVTDANNALDEKRYHNLILRAISSVYAFDIDAGNLETTKQRLFNSLSIVTDKQILNNDSAVQFWVKYLKTNTNTQQTEEILTNIVEDSLNLAEENWANFLRDNPGGVVGQLYRKHTGKHLSDETLISQIQQILNNNIKLFNGIVKEDTNTEQFVCPGWNNVVWDWWNISEDCEITSEPVRLAEQMISGEIEKLEHKTEQLKNEKMVETNDGLFSMTSWVDKVSENEYNKLIKQIAKLKKELNN